MRNEVNEQPLYEERQKRIDLARGTVAHGRSPDAGFTSTYLPIFPDRINDVACKDSSNARRNVEQVLVREIIRSMRKALENYQKCLVRRQTKRGCDTDWHEEDPGFVALWPQNEGTGPFG